MFEVLAYGTTGMYPEPINRPMIRPLRIAVAMTLAIAVPAIAQIRQLANWGHGDPCHTSLGPGRCTAYHEWRVQGGGFVTLYRPDGSVFRKRDAGASVDSALYADANEAAAARRAEDDALEAELPR